MTQPKIKGTLIHYYVSKHVFSWRPKNYYIWCIITWKSRFSHDAPKRCKFVALLRGKAGFLMMQPKTKCIFDALLRFEAGFLITRQNSYIWCIITWKGRVSHDTPKRCKVVALLRLEAGFLMTRQKLLYLMHYNVEKQVFLWCAKKVQICCINTFRSRFSHNAPNTLIFDVLLRGNASFLMTQPKTKWTFDALLRFIAGFLMTRQKLIYLVLYYVEKYAPKLKCVYWCFITWRSSFSHGTPNYHYIWYIFSLKTTFYCDAKDKNECIWFIIRRKSRLI